MPSVLMTSTMKSDPGVPPMRLGAISPGVCVSAAATRALGGSADGARVFWASSSSAPRDRGGAMALAALAATNPVRNLRRSLRAMTAPSSLWMVGGVYSKLAPYGGTAFGISEHERNMRAEQNELLTRTGPGTPMGELFRRYWLPALLAEELPEPDCPPVRVKILGERLIAFRDTQNRFGLIDEFCAHRGASLWFGRNEEGGLRCSYHGWKYDMTGQCVEIPSEPGNPKLCQRMKLKSYPLVERGGVLWPYRGPANKRPPLPEHEWAMVPAANRFVSKRWQGCNWLQAMEGGIDSSHVSFLHRYTMKVDPMFKGATQSHQYNLQDLAPHFEVVESPGGLYIGARRNAENNNYYWRITQYVIPAFTLIPPRGDHPIGGHSWVPMDDENCWAWSTNHHATRALTREERDAMVAGKGIHVPAIPGTFRPVANKDNDYLMDRKAQKDGRSF